MSNWGHLLVRLYRVLLAFYPVGFRAKFGEEMQADFQSALIESRYDDKERTWQLLCREFRNWPGSVWREHLIELSN